MSSDSSGEVSYLSVLFILPFSWSIDFNPYCYVSLPCSFEFNAMYTNPFVASIALRHRDCLKNTYLTRSVPSCPQELPLSLVHGRCGRANCNIILHLLNMTGRRSSFQIAFSKLVLEDQSHLSVSSRRSVVSVRMVNSDIPDHYYKLSQSLEMDILTCKFIAPWELHHNSVSIFYVRMMKRPPAADLKISTELVSIENLHEVNIDGGWIALCAASSWHVREVVLKGSNLSRP